MLKTAVLISGRGSNLQALLDDTKQPGSPARIVVVISNILEAAGLDRARAAGVPTLVVNHKTYGNREMFDRELDAKLNDHGVQLICLAGFMRLLTPWFV
jgi:phosphoribosylglycinamide formyltransferase-1